MDTLLNIGLGNAFLACLLALAAGTVSLLGRRPALAHGLWLLVLLKLVTPPLVQWNMPQIAFAGNEPPAPEAASVPVVQEPPVIVLVDSDSAPAPDIADVAPEESPTRPPTPEPNAPPALVNPAEASAPSLQANRPALLLGIWAAGSVGWLALTLVRVQRFRRLLRHARPAPTELVSEVGDLARRFGLAHPPEVLLVPGPVSPMVWGLFGSPRLLVPVELLDRLDGEQRTTLLAHELAHLRRRDHWVRFLELLATGLYWWNPVVWFARKAIREAEEECCDAWVVWLLPDAAKSYAGALLETVIFLTDAVAVPPVASGVGPFPILKRRLTMIMRGTRPRSLSAVGLLGVLGLGAALLPWGPGWAQSDPNRPGVEFKKDAKPEEIDKAVQEARKAVEELQQARARLQEAEKRLMEAQRRMIELTGGDGKVIIRMSKDGPHVAQDRVWVDFGQVDPKTAEEIAAITAQVKAREAQVEEAKARLAHKRISADRMQQLQKQNAVTNDDVETAATEAKIAEAQLKAKQAELEEARVRLEAAKKRMQESAHRAAGAEAGKVLIQRGGFGGAGGPGAPGGGAAGVIRGGAGGEGPTIIWHEMRNPMMPPAIAVPAGADGERRLQDLERKLGDLLKEVQGLRQDIARPGTRPVAPPSPPSPPSRNP